MSLKSILQERADAPRRQALAEVKASVEAAADAANARLPAIDTASSALDKWIKQNLSGIPWHAVGGMPKRIQELLAQGEQLKNNAATIRGALDEINKLTVAEAWGKRPDGQRRESVGQHPKRFIAASQYRQNNRGGDWRYS